MGQKRKPCPEMQNDRTVRSPGEVQQTMRRLRALHVPTGRNRDLALQLGRLLEVDDDGNQIPRPSRFTADLETRGVALIEPPGGGKTTAIRKVLSNSVALNPPDAPSKYLCVQVPSPATLKSLGLEILRKTGLSDISERATAWEIWNLVRFRLSRTETVVLWIDEAHDLFSCRSAREIEDMLKMLKSLMQGDAAVILILSGTERLSEITSFDPQVNRRFTKIMPPDLAIGADETRLTGLMEQYAKEAGLGTDWQEAFSSRLIKASRGRFGRAVETIVNAIEVALLEGSETLSIVHFAEAWGMAEGCPWDRNIFVSPHWASEPLDAGAEAFEAARTERMTKQMAKG